MPENERPGGLTALAIINFLWAMPQLFGVLWMGLFYFGSGWLREHLSGPEIGEVIEAMNSLPTAAKVFDLASTSAVAALLLLSGIGYLKQRKILGRALGNAYAALHLLSAVLGLTVLSHGPDDGFDVGTMIAVAYPLVTLYFVNVVFREDLVH